MKPLPRRPGATEHSGHSYLPPQQHRSSTTLWLPILLALVLLALGGLVWLKL